MKRATLCVNLVDNNVTISIHALVKRATVVLYLLTLFSGISIHALVKRATYDRITVPLW